MAFPSAKHSDQQHETGDELVKLHSQYGLYALLWRRARFTKTTFELMEEETWKSLPDSIGHLSRLRELHLRNNKLSSLPESMSKLHELRQIDLRGNPLTHLPAAIAALPRLEKLDLRWVNTLPLPHWIADLEARGCAVYR
ncbi:MAG TPA: leucine-rich repeat domain-containing protein [Candidatus Angelobacter sp.]